MKSFQNILFIVVDDLRPEINCFGKRKLITPNIDRLAQRGLRFDHAVCQMSVCMPSRASALSGARPNDQWRDHLIQMCPRGEPSLPGHFKNSGFTTVSVGKVYHYNDDDPASWTRRYTDTFADKDKGWCGDGYCAGYQLPENRRRQPNTSRQWTQDKSTLELPPLCECADAPESAYPDGIVAHRAIEALREFHQRRPRLFLAAGFYRPHLPWAVPKKYWDLYCRADVDLADNPFFPQDGVGGSDLCDLLHYGDDVVNQTYCDIGRYDADNFPILNPEKQRECIHGYWASVSFTDAQIGKMLDELDRLGLTEQTAIVLWGDNGWHLGEHKLWSKTTSFEESTRVPLIVAAPGYGPAGNTEALTELVDIYPTLCDLAGLSSPTHLEGLSLRPLLQTPQRPWKQAVFSRIHDAQTLRTPRYRFTRYAQPNPAGDRFHLPNAGAVELFDLQRDPRENVNVAKRPEYAPVVAELDRLLTAGWRAALPTAPPLTAQPLAAQAVKAQI